MTFNSSSNSKIHNWLDLITFLNIINFCHMSPVVLPPTPKLTLSGLESSTQDLFNANTSIAGPFSTPENTLAISYFLF